MAKLTKKQRKEQRIANGGLVCTDPHLTKQSHKNECDINRVMDRARHGASLSHLLNHGGNYGDFSHVTEDWMQNTLDTIADANSIFYDLPAELRTEFNNSPGAFFEFVNNPDNADRLDEIFPALSEPGRQLLNPTTTSEPAPTAPVEPPAESTPAEE